MRKHIARSYRATGASGWLGWAFVLALTSTVLVNVPLPLSRSGELEVSVADFVAATAWALLGYLLVTRRWMPSRTSVALMVAVGVFCLWFLVVTAARFARSDEVLQAFLVLRSTLLPLAGYLLLDTKLEPRRRALHGLVIFEVLLNLWHLGEWQNMRMSDFLGNSIVYAGLIVVLLPLNVYVAASGSAAPTWVRWSAAINMLAALVFPVWTGSRGVSAVAFVVIVVCFLIMLHARRGVRLMLGVAAGALVVQAAVWWVNPQGAAYGIYRLVPPPAEIGTPMVYEGQASSDLAQRETALTEKVKSDAGRADLVSASVERIRQDPLIGDGTVYFDLPGDGVVQEYAAHNFVLEHVNAFGAIGFLGYLSFFVIALWPSLRLLRRAGEPRTVALLAGITTAGLLTFSLTQPTTLIMAIVVPYFLAIAALLAPDHEPRAEEARQ